MYPVAIGLLVAVTLLLVVICIWKLTTSKSPTKNKSYLLFIDAPDPDNLAAALAVWHCHIQCRHKPHLNHSNKHLHIVLTGRQINLRTVNKAPSTENILRQDWEKSNPNHAQRVLEDSAVRITNYLTKCGVPSTDFTIYDGGIAPYAPISDVVHVLDFLFDRKDLVTGDMRHQGEMLFPVEYDNLVMKYNKLGQEERQRKLLEVLRRYKLSPLKNLEIELLPCEDVCIFLGGPATALVKLFSGSTGEKLANNVTEFYGMFGSLEPGTSTLLSNQFNVACDFEAASALFVDNLLPDVQKYLISTETAKLPDLVISADELQAHEIKNYIVSLQRLWEAAHQGRPQPLFDVLTVMASVTLYKECFSWLKKKAVIQEWMNKDRKMLQIFSFAESESHNLLVSSDYYKSDRHTYIQFMKQSL